MRVATHARHFHVYRIARPAVARVRATCRLRRAGPSRPQAANVHHTQDLLAAGGQYSAASSSWQNAGECLFLDGTHPARRTVRTTPHHLT